METIRESLTIQQRSLPLQHGIDPGFVNHRRILALIGEEGRLSVERAVAAIPPMPEGLREAHVRQIYAAHMLTFCKVLGALPLGQVIANRKGRLFCSTESLAPCRTIYGKRERAVSKWKAAGRGVPRVEFHYTVSNVTSDTLRSQLYSGNAVSIIGEFAGVQSDGVVVFHPLVMGGPLVFSDDDSLNAGVMWWSTEFFENVVEDFDEFSQVRNLLKPKTFDEMKVISERAFKTALAEIIGGSAPKDWGGETSDFFSSHLNIGGRRVSGAFLLKGPGSRFAPMSLNHLGKGNDQICRLANEPADVLFVQHCHEIQPAVRSTLRAFAVQPSRPRRYCLIDGRDSLWLLRAYGLYDKALEFTRQEKIGRKRVTVR